jgi:hypothetical protein
MTVENYKKNTLELFKNYIFDEGFDREKNIIPRFMILT